MNENYWKEFYKDKEVAEPSDFAKFCNIKGERVSRHSLVPTLPSRF